MAFCWGPTGGVRDCLLPWLLFYCCKYYAIPSKPIIAVVFLQEASTKMQVLLLLFICCCCRRDHLLSARVSASHPMNRCRRFVGFDPKRRCRGCRWCREKGSRLLLSIGCRARVNWSCRIFVQDCEVNFCEKKTRRRGR